MFVSDLRHFLDMPDDVPGPARRMGEHLVFVVRAATAGPAGDSWTTSLPCRRRPGHRPCPGRMMVFRADLPAPIDWKCSSCGDEGTISGWEGSPFDLRRQRSRLTGRPGDRVGVIVSDEVAATLRDLVLMDTDSERLVFSARPADGGVVLAADEDDLDELVGFVAAEANHEANRRRQKRLDDAFAVLSDAIGSR
ncbi:MAG: hypothetical protein M3Y91_05735 [Actinomycetota bacterium]|nr:hypothetical protein [Actinomycetota bacterium]